jgi:hypothetical protein
MHELESKKAEAVRNPCPTQAALQPFHHCLGEELQVRPPPSRGRERRLRHCDAQTYQTATRPILISTSDGLPAAQPLC